MQNLNILHPEIGQVYMIRRFINGPVWRRWQPAKLLDMVHMLADPATNRFEGRYLTVQWLNDNEVQSEILEVHGAAYGTVRVMRAKDLQEWLERSQQELAAAQAAVERMTAAMSALRRG